MKSIETLKQKLLYKRISSMSTDELTLEDGTTVSFECTDQDCCASAWGEWKTAELDAVITDVRITDSYQDDSDEPYNTAVLTIFHNQNPVAQADLYADAGNGGYYYSVLSVFINEDNIGEILCS